MRRPVVPHCVDEIPAKSEAPGFFFFFFLNPGRLTMAKCRTFVDVKYLKRPEETGRAGLGVGRAQPPLSPLRRRALEQQRGLQCGLHLRAPHPAADSSALVSGLSVCAFSPLFTDT